MPKVTTPHSSYDSYNLFKAVDEHLTRDKFRAYTGQNNRPSEASVKFYDPQLQEFVVEGACLRKVWYRHKFSGERAAPQARAQFIFMAGNALEDALVETFKQMGIWVANSVRFKDDKWGISGELDVILREPDGTVYGGEIKTAYGYYSEKEVIGNTYQQGTPKFSQLLQTLIYTYLFKDKLAYFRMIYLFRDSCARRTFKIELEEKDGKHYPKIDGQVNWSFAVEDVLARYDEIDEYVSNNELPPRDFELEYSDEKVEKLHKLKKISDTKYKKHFAPRKPVKAGDWQCSYCDFNRVCWETPNGLPEDDDLSKLIVINEDSDEDIEL